MDLIEGDEGPQVLEVNASPGLEGIERATGADLAMAIVEHLERLTPIAEAPASVRPRLRDPLVAGALRTRGPSPPLDCDEPRLALARGLTGGDAGPVARQRHSPPIREPPPGA